MSSNNRFTDGGGGGRPSQQEEEEEERDVAPDGDPDPDLDPNPTPEEVEEAADDDSSSDPNAISGNRVDHETIQRETDDPTRQRDDDPAEDDPNVERVDHSAVRVRDAEDATARDDEVGQQARELEQRALDELGTDDPTFVTVQFDEDSGQLRAALTDSGEERLRDRRRFEIRQDIAGDLPGVEAEDVSLDEDAQQFEVEADALAAFLAEQDPVLDEEDIASVERVEQGDGVVLQPVLTDQAVEERARENVAEQLEDVGDLAQEAPDHPTPGQLEDLASVGGLADYDVDDLEFEATDDGVSVGVSEAAQRGPLRERVAARDDRITPDDVVLEDTPDGVRASADEDALAEALRRDVAEEHDDVEPEDVEVTVEDGELSAEVEVEQRTKEQKFLDKYVPDIPNLDTGADIDVRADFDIDVDPTTESPLTLEVDVDTGTLPDPREFEAPEVTVSDPRDVSAQDVLPPIAYLPLAAGGAVRNPGVSRGAASLAAGEAAGRTADAAGTTREAVDVGFDAGALSPGSSEDISQDLDVDRSDVERDALVDAAMDARGSADIGFDAGALSPGASEEVSRDLDVNRSNLDRETVTSDVSDRQADVDGLFDAGAMSPGSSEDISQDLDVDRSDVERDSTRDAASGALGVFDIGFDGGALSPGTAEEVSRDAGFGPDELDTLLELDPDDILPGEEGLEAGPRGAPEGAAAGAVAAPRRAPPGGATGVLVRRSPVGTGARGGARILKRAAVGAGILGGAAVAADRASELEVTDPEAVEELGVGATIPQEELGVGETNVAELDVSDIRPDAELEATRGGTDITELDVPGDLVANASPQFAGQVQRGAAEEPSITREERQTDLQRLIEEGDDVFGGRRDPRGAFREERRYPTGEGAVIGREVQRMEEAAAAEVTENVETGGDVSDILESRRRTRPGEDVVPGIDTQRLADLSIEDMTDQADLLDVGVDQLLDVDVAQEAVGMQQLQAVETGFEPVEVNVQAEEYATEQAFGQAEVVGQGTVLEGVGIDLPDPGPDDSGLDPLGIVGRRIEFDVLSQQEASAAVVDVTTDDLTDDLDVNVGTDFEVDMSGLEDFDPSEGMGL